MSSLFEEIYKLKLIQRRGWILRDCCKEVGRTESDAEHCFSCMMLAIEIMEREKLDLDQLKVLKIIAVHELCEIDAGDHTPIDDITLEEKYRLELEGVKRLAKEHDLPWVLDLWLEFEEAKTPEAKFAKQMDKLDCIMQSKVYSKLEGRSELYQEFYEHGKNKIGDYQKYLDEIEI